MRIVHVNDIASVASTLAAGQRTLGHQAEVVEPTRVGFGSNPLIRALLLPVRWIGLLAVAVRLRRSRPDVVHVHYAWKGLVGILSGRRYVLHCHGSDVRGIGPRSIRGRLNRLAERRAAMVYYATPDLSPWVLRDRPDAIFLPNPIDVGAFSPSAGHAAPAPSSTGRPWETVPGEQRDLLVGVRLDPIKGLDSIVEIVGLVAASRPQTTFTIVAQGRGVDAVADAAGSRALVIGRVERSLLPDLYRAHRLAIGQFRVGALGNYELECLAAGLPVVMRFDFGTAYREPPPLANVSAAREAAARVCHLLDDPDARRKLAAAGSAWVRANHDATSVARRVLADYQALGFGSS